MNIRTAVKIDVLDRGSIEVLDKLGTDMSIVNAARVSLGKSKPNFAELDEADKKLLRYLAEHQHTSPFRQVMLQMRLIAPEFVMRHLYKHVVGIEGTSYCPTKDHGWNEISGRYTEYDHFYYPAQFRSQAKGNKQASGGDLEVDPEKTAQQIYAMAITEQYKYYKRLLEIGVAREQARTILPLSLYSEVIWTASFQAIAHLIGLRDSVDAQWETREYAVALKKIVLDYFPNACKAWFGE